MTLTKAQRALQPPELLFNAAYVTHVVDGSSATWMSRKHPGVVWIANDHEKHPDNHGLFAVDIETDELLFSAHATDSPWGDVEAMFGYQSTSGNWYLNVYDNASNTMLVFVEPDMLVRSQMTIKPHNKVLIHNSGNDETAFYDPDSDRVYIIQRGGTRFTSDPLQVDIVSNWSKNRNRSSVETGDLWHNAFGIVGKVPATGTRNGIGDGDLVDGIAYLAGVGGTRAGEDRDVVENHYLYVFENWDELVTQAIDSDRPIVPTMQNRVDGVRSNECIFTAPDGSWSGFGGESNAQSTVGNFYRVRYSSGSTDIIDRIDAAITHVALIGAALTDQIAKLEALGRDLNEIKREAAL